MRNMSIAYDYATFRRPSQVAKEADLEQPQTATTLSVGAPTDTPTTPIPPEIEVSHRNHFVHAFACIALSTQYLNHFSLEIDRRWIQFAHFTGDIHFDCVHFLRCNRLQLLGGMDIFWILLFRFREYVHDWFRRLRATASDAHDGQHSLFDIRAQVILKFLKLFSNKFKYFCLYDLFLLIIKLNYLRDHSIYF